MEKAVQIGFSKDLTQINALIFLSESYYFNKEQKKAYNVLNKVLEIDKKNIDALYNLGSWKLRQRKYNESIIYLNKVI